MGKIEDGEKGIVRDVKDKLAGNISRSSEIVDDERYFLIKYYGLKLKC